MITTRPATLDDLATLRRFEQGIVHSERPFDSTFKPGEIQYYDIEAMLVDPRVQFLVAEADGVPVGSGFARLDPAKPYDRHARQAYLGLMYVEPAFRGRGINAEVIEALKAWCLEQGVRELRLQVHARNSPALRAYERAGFAAHLAEMRLELPAG